MKDRLEPVMYLLSTLFEFALLLAAIYTLLRL